MHKIFTLSGDKISFAKEIYGGIINFMACSYIIAVNPIILNADGKAFPMIPMITATVITMFIMTILAGFIIKLPFVLAPGMGINAIVSYTLVIHEQLPIETALGIVFLSSLLLFVLSITPIRSKVINAIPINLQYALSIGIGLFLVLIGFHNVKLIINNPNTLLSLSKINIQLLLTFLGFFIAATLFIHKKNYAFLLTIIVITIINMIITPSMIPTQIVDMPDFSLFNKIDFVGALKFSVIPAVLSLFIVNFFDATASMVGLLEQIDYKDYNERDSYLKRSLATDGLGGVVSALFGTSAAIVFVESSSGIHSGAKTGFASVVSGLLCLPFLFFAPLVAAVPPSATAPILVLVGILMMKDITKLKIEHLEEFIAVILTIIMMPFCFSITAGAVFGILSYTVLKISLGKFKEISPSLLIVSICCVGWFFIH